MTKLIGVVSLASFAALVACGGGNQGGAVKQNFGIDFSNAPPWVLKGNGAYSGDKGKVFRGVGSVGGSRNFSMAKSTADLRARAEIAKTLNSFVSALNKSYQATTTAGDMSASSEEQHATEAIKSFAQVDLSGAEIVDHWVANEGTVFSLAELNMQGMKDNLDKMKELNAKVRDAVRANADKAFDELAGEEAKHSNK